MNIRFFPILLFSLLVLNANISQAQNHAVRDFTISPAIGIGGFGNYGNYTTFSLPVIVQAEYGLTDELSFGPFISYSRFKYGGVISYAYNWHVINVGGRVSYRFMPLIEQLASRELNTGKWDFYATAFLSYENVVYRAKEGPLPNGGTRLKTRLRFGPSLGAKYYIKPNIAPFVETGITTFGTISAGVSLGL
ncbi:MAG: hypothetical protein R3D00_04625 [Bacteroidia bacterium]